MLLVSDRLISSSFDETIKLWDLETGDCVDSWRTPRPYEGLNITATEGITAAQAATLMALGAVRTEPSVLPFVRRLDSVRRADRISR
jgi:WD40 repeat protein